MKPRRLYKYQFAYGQDEMFEGHRLRGAVYTTIDPRNFDTPEDIDSILNGYCGLKSFRKLLKNDDVTWYFLMNCETGRVLVYKKIRDFYPDPIYGPSTESNPSELDLIKASIEKYKGV